MAIGAWLAESKTPWWHGAVGYEVYIRSFADSDGDGIGDLQGVVGRLDHLAWLGVDILWVTPFYRSPGFDHGYDVSDYVDVDLRHGTLADFDELVARAHDLGIRLVIDMVPNHTSYLHDWFREACKGPDNPYRDYYLWRDPAGDGGPPNNWVSHFGGPAWTRDDASGQYYCHLFLPQQPDLNWRNEKVREEFDRILRFWLERGMDGFRIDVAHGLLKDPEFRDNPRTAADEYADEPNWQVFFSYDHRYDLDQDETIEIYRRWHTLTEPYGALLLGEIGLDDPARIARYVGPSLLDCAFFLEPPWMDWDPAAILDVLRGMQERDPDRVAWAVDNHDHSRSATRYGGGPRGARRSLAVTTLITCLGGIPFLYQGQELGIGDGVVAPDDLTDPIATRNVGAVGRDGARTPMPWTPGPGNGFTSGVPWLPATQRPALETVAVQSTTPDSQLHQYRDLIAMRHAVPDLWVAPLVWRPTDSPSVAAFVRGSTSIVANFSPQAVDVSLDPGQWEATYSSSSDSLTITGSIVVVPAETTVVLRAK